MAQAAGSAAEFARRSRWLLLLVAAAVTASAAWHLTTGPERVDCLPTRTTGQDWYPVCEGTAFTRAAAYEGAGPHPIVIYGGAGPGGGASADPDKPPSTWRPAAPGQVRLVSCAEPIDEDTGLGPEAAQCPVYSRVTVLESAPTGEITLYRTRYLVRLLEARTGREVHRFEVTGADEVCPARPSRRDVLLRSGILPSQYRAMLAPYVDGPAR
ncbi:hypothetical protein OHR68_16535 [Spirillospora sp. NBC_00431]